jgi:hypothetical protein
VQYIIFIVLHAGSGKEWPVHCITSHRVRGLCSKWRGGACAVHQLHCVCGMCITSRCIVLHAASGENAFVQQVVSRGCALHHVTLCEWHAHYITLHCLIGRRSKW